MNNSSLHSFSPTYFPYWLVGFPSLTIQDPKEYKELWFDVLESRERGSFGSYKIKPCIQSKELYPLVLPLKGFEPNETIRFSLYGEEYEFPALIYAHVLGVRVDIHVGVRVVAVAVRVCVRQVVIGVQNNDSYYIKTYKFKEFQKIWLEAKSKDPNLCCLYDCLVFPEIGGQPIRTLLPWFMMKEIGIKR